MAGGFFVFMDEKESESTNSQKQNEADFQPSCRTSLGKSFFKGNSGQSRAPSCPTRVANHSERYKSSCPLSDLAIRSESTPNRFRSHSQSKYLFHFSAGVVYKSTVACQGERVKLHCRNASLGLTIHSASYGRTEPGAQFCPYNGSESDKDYSCGESNVADAFKTLCERRNRCRVKVNSALFRDPCPEKPKKHLYLILIYTCGECLTYIYLNGSKSYNSADVKHSPFLSVNQKLFLKRKQCSFP